MMTQYGMRSEGSDFDPLAALMRYAAAKSAPTVQARASRAPNADVNNGTPLPTGGGGGWDGGGFGGGDFGGPIEPNPLPDPGPMPGPTVTTGDPRYGGGPLNGGIVYGPGGQPYGIDGGGNMYPILRATPADGSADPGTGNFGNMPTMGGAGGVGVDYGAMLIQAAIQAMNQS